jgi:hypothetical protein
MKKLLIPALTFSLAIFAIEGVHAGPRLQLSQNDGQDTATPPSGNTGLLRQNYITSTGATVPRPGVSQSGGSTPLDHDIKRLDNKIDHSICKGC